MLQAPRRRSTVAWIQPVFSDPPGHLGRGSPSTNRFSKDSAPLRRNSSLDQVPHSCTPTHLTCFLILSRRSEEILHCCSRRRKSLQNSQRRSGSSKAGHRFTRTKDVNIFEQNVSQPNLRSCHLEAR